MLKIFAITLFIIYNIIVYKRASSKIKGKEFVNLLLILISIYAISFYPSTLIADSNPKIATTLSNIAESSIFSLFFLFTYTFAIFFYGHIDDFSTIGLVNFTWMAKLFGFIFLVVTIFIQFVILFDYGFWEYIQNQFLTNIKN